MKNQFFYTRKENVGTEDAPKTLEFRDSFNINKIIRSVRVSEESLLVLLDDIHQRTQEVPNINTKTNKVIGTKKETNTYQTEVYLSGEDIERFYNITNVE